MDTLTPAERSERMSRVKAKGSKAELLVRRLAQKLGYRFRLHRRDLPGTPDLVFPARRKVVFVHGCFWHRHTDPDCRFARLPKSRQEFWLPKLEANRLRDAANQKKLRDLGWDNLVLWECELNDTASIRNKLRTFLSDELC